MLVNIEGDSGEVGQYFPIRILVWYTYYTVLDLGYIHYFLLFVISVDWSTSLHIIVTKTLESARFEENRKYITKILTLCRGGTKRRGWINSILSSVWKASLTCCYERYKYCKLWNFVGELPQDVRRYISTDLLLW